MVDHFLEVAHLSSVQRLIIIDFKILSVIEFLLLRRQCLGGKAVVDDSNNSTGSGYQKYAIVSQSLVYNWNLKIGM